MKQPNPNNYDSEEEYEKAQSQYEDYANEKYEQEKDGNWTNHTSNITGTFNSSTSIFNNIIYKE